MSKLYVYNGKEIKYFKDGEKGKKILCNAFINAEPMNYYKSLGIEMDEGACDIIVQVGENIHISQDYKYMNMDINIQAWENLLDYIKKYL